MKQTKQNDVLNETISPQDEELNKEIEKDIATYKHAEENITKSFINSIIQLGEILATAKEKYKEERAWNRYLLGIGRSLMHANQFIRIYDYSKTNMKTLLESNITGWNQAYTFLSLPDEVKQEFKELSKMPGKKMKETAKALRNLKKSTKEEVEDTEVEEPEVEVIADGDKVEHIEMDVPINPIDNSELNLREIIGNSTLVDTHFMAKHVIKEFNKTDSEFSQKCLPMVEGVLNIEKMLKELDNKNFKKSLSDKELRYWSTQLKIQAKRLVEALLIFDK